MTVNRQIASKLTGLHSEDRPLFAAENRPKAISWSDLGAVLQPPESPFSSADPSRASTSSALPIHLLHLGQETNWRHRLAAVSTRAMSCMPIPQSPPFPEVSAMTPDRRRVSRRCRPKPTMRPPGVGSNNCHIRIKGSLHTV